VLLNRIAYFIFYFLFNRNVCFMDILMLHPTSNSIMFTEARVNHPSLFNSESGNIVAIKKPIKEKGLSPVCLTP
jgi:hypothetical protein